MPATWWPDGEVAATIEYAVIVLGVKHIIVCGHSDCGAMKAVLHPKKVEHLPTVRNWLGRRVVSRRKSEVPDGEALRAITEQNVVAQLANLRTHSCVAAPLKRGVLTIHGWVYSIHTAEVDAWDEGRGRFVPLRIILSARPRNSRGLRWRAIEINRFF